MAGFALLLAIGFALFWLSIVAYTVRVLTHPPRRTYATALARGRPGDPSESARARDFRSWSFTRAGVEFPVWEIRGDRETVGRGATVILTHGWGDSRIGALTRLEALAPFASRLIAWDMRGHGDAGGRCALGAREMDDLLALIARVAGEPPTSDFKSQISERGDGSEKGPEPAGPIVLYGWSLGAGVSIEATARLVEASAAGTAPIAAVIAESPYRLPPTPARNVLRVRALPWRVNIPAAFAMLGIGLGMGVRWTRRGGFDRAAWAARMRTPLLVIHGEHDEICPAEDGREIAAAAGGTFAPVPAGSHNDLWTDPALAATCADRVREFLGRLREGAGVAPAGAPSGT